MLKHLPALALFASLASCAKPIQDLASEVLPTPTTCGQAGARVEAIMDGTSFCANAQVIAVGDGSSLMVTGVGLLGSTLVLQIDSLALGTHAISEAENGMLFMEAGSNFTSTSTDPGTITITQADTVARRFTASFEVTLHNLLSGAARHLQGNADVTWTSGN